MGRGLPAPLGAIQAPSHCPSWGVIAAVLALGLLGTVAGQLIYFRMIYRYGSARASLVVYLLPVTALFYGALLLDEPLDDLRDRRARADPGRHRARLGRGPAAAPGRCRRCLVSDAIPGDGFRLRRATAEDVDFLLELAAHEDVEPFLRAVRPRDREGVLEEIERSLARAEGVRPLRDRGRGGRQWRRAGVMGFDIANERNRIANLGGLAVHPDFRGRSWPTMPPARSSAISSLDLDFHRLQLEIYGFNERAIQHAERSGFIREGVEAQGVLAPRRVGRRRAIRPTAEDLGDRDPLP